MKTLMIPFMAASGALLLTAACGPVRTAQRTRSENPVFAGWYADPEGVVFDDEYWIFPTLSD